MKKKFETLERIPTWALCYLINGDPSALNDEEIEMVDKFCEKFPGAIYCPITINDDGDFDIYFSRYPAFGLACNVVDTEIIIFED